MTRIFCSILLFLSSCFYVSGQVCEGNLGGNIFIDGNFGSGTSNILLPDPQIAPGYIYQSFPPPDDGFYTITNNTSSWGSFAQFWDNIGDNSDDPQGYMMIVNASFQPGVFYEQIVDGLCENTLYVFSADVYNLIDEIKPNISFQLDGITLYDSGDVPYNNTWNTYGFTFSTQANQTSLTLSIKNNAPGGIGNDLALDNISFSPCGPEALILPTEIANICEDGSPIELAGTIIGNQYDSPVFQWQESFDEGLTWVNISGANEITYTHTKLSAGLYYYRYLLANNPTNLLNSKCRVISNSKIVRVIPKFYTIVDTLCQGLSFELGDNSYSASGMYVDSLISVIGCDSILTLDLTIVPDSEIELTIEPKDPSCSYLQDGSIIIDSVVNAAAPYTLFLDGEINNTGGNLSNLGEGEYMYSITDRFGCFTDTLVSLNNPDPFTLELGPDQPVDLGESVVINPTFSALPETIQWGSGDIIDCDIGCGTLEYLPTETELLVLTATSLESCIAMDTLLITVKDVRKVYIPNTFSPNNDRVNDYFTVFGDQPNLKIIEYLMIYDRWGNLIFEQNNIQPNVPELGWDGSDDYNVLRSGVYTYLAAIRFLDEELLIYSGDITLIK